MAYAFGRVNRSDFLRAMDEDFPDELTAKVYSEPHNVWETAVWTKAANRRLVRRADGHWSMVPGGEVLPTDKVLPNELRPCRLKVRDDGVFTFELRISLLTSSCMTEEILMKTSGPLPKLWLNYTCHFDRKPRTHHLDLQCGLGQIRMCLGVP